MHTTPEPSVRTGKVSSMHSAQMIPTRASLFAHAREPDRIGRVLVGEQRCIAMSRTRQNFLAVLF